MSKKRMSDGDCIVLALQILIAKWVFGEEFLLVIESSGVHKSIWLLCGLHKLRAREQKAFATEMRE